MKISPFAIEEISPFIKGDDFPPTRTGRELVTLFNKFGSRDVYDENGLPDIDKKNKQRPSRKEYVKARINSLNGTNELRELICHVINELDSKSIYVERLNKILNPEGNQVVQNGEELEIQGGVIVRKKPIVNEAHFKEIQNRIVSALEDARVSIRVVMAWFTNDTLFKKLVEKQCQGIDVQVAIYDDGINKKHGVDIAQIPNTKISRGKKGGLMHDKFCVIDNQIVITGSYNWSDNAEFKNDENVTVEHDPEQATRYSEEYQRLTAIKKE